MRVLSIGTMEGISNTCRFRTLALKRIVSDVDVVNCTKKISFLYRLSNKLFQKGIPVYLPDCSNENKKIISQVKKNKYDIIWIDKGLTICPDTLKIIHKIQPNAKIVNYSPDNMIERHNQSQNYLDCIPLYDYHFTTKSFILNELCSMGAKNVYFVRKSYEDTFHYPRQINYDDLQRLGADVGFVGAWEQDRMESILYLTRNGIKVRVFGNKEWKKCKGDNDNLIIENHGLYDEDYAKSFKCFKISLCFLRKINYDQQTSRTMEIPACGGFMIAERTEEHLKLFKENKEAVFFSSNEELLKKCLYYLSHEKEREKIAKAGYRRCVNSGYSNVETLKKLLMIIQ